jgi:hypothetical protein
VSELTATRAPKIRKTAAPASKLRAGLLLFCGTFALFLAVWKGDGGYVDLVEYLDDAERLWLHFDLRLPADPMILDDIKVLRELGQATDAELEEMRIDAEKPRYNRYALGLPVLAGPLVWLGAVLEKISGGVIGPRGMAALTIPLLGATACLLLYEIGLLLNIPAPAALWSAIVFALGSPLLVYTRLFFTETALVFCILLSIWAFLKSHTAFDRRAVLWYLLAGAALAMLTFCHYGNVWISASLGLAYTVAMSINRDRAISARVFSIMALAAFPIVTACGILLLNHSRYGSPFATGGYDYDVEYQLKPMYFVYNLRYLAMWLMRVPWLLPAMFFGAKLFKQHRLLGAGIFLAATIQTLFWLHYQFLGFFPYRYPQSITALYAVGLLFLAATIFRFGPWLRCSLAAILIALNIFFMLSGDTKLLAFGDEPAPASVTASDCDAIEVQPQAHDDGDRAHLKTSTASAKFIFRGDDTQSRPFRWENRGSSASPDWELQCYVWYMKPLPKNSVATASAMGGLQWCMLVLLLSTGVQLLVFAAWQSKKVERGQANRATRVKTQPQAMV